MKRALSPVSSNKAESTNRTVTFHDDTVENPRLDIILSEILDSDFATFLWPGGEVLAHYLWRFPESVFGQRVIELGAGVALPGLVAAKLQAKTIAITDRSDGATGLANVRRAVQLNGLGDGSGSRVDGSSSCVEVFGLSWGEFDESTLSRLLPSPTTSSSSNNGDGEEGIASNFDVVLGADCFYTTEAFDDILATVHLLICRHSPIHQPTAPLEMPSRSSPVQQSMRPPGRDGTTVVDAAAEKGPESRRGNEEEEVTAAAQAAAGCQLRSPLTPQKPKRKRRFIATYHERCAGRSIRSKLARWRLALAEVVPLASFLPAHLVDEPRFASISLFVLEEAANPLALP